MKKTNILLLLMLVVVSTVFSQLTPLKTLNTNQLNNSISESCGFDHMHDKLLNSNLDYRQRTEGFNNFIKSYNAPKSGATYVIPVVVHVMHKGESVGTGSNISEEDINQGILQLNERFRKIPGSLGDGNGVDVDVEFALAVRNPSGNCTNGIVRVDMTGSAPYMSAGVKYDGSEGITDAALKSTSRWNTLQYYNIYLVSEIDNNDCGGGIQGYAYFASAHGQSYDGMIQLGCKFAQSGNTTLTHELGHALNLYHTFEGDDDGDSCPANNNCNSEGDRCCDTPPHIRSASNCAAGTNPCDGGSSKELFIHNYMDYSSDACQSEFTADQKTRAIAAISVTRASYLAENGNMSLVPPSTAGVDFSVSSSVVCLGSPVTFYDESTCIPNTYQNGGWPNITFLWTFDDGVNPPITSTDQNPTVNFAQAGSYDVTLEITNGSGTTSLTKSGFVSVANGVQSSTCENTSNNTGNYGYTISKVVFNSINSSSSSSINGAWQDLTCSKNTQVTQGQNYDLEVTVNAGGSGLGLQFRAYIDYNDDGAYAAEELVLSNSILDNTSQTFTTSVNIPLTSTTDQLLRLRVISDGGTLTGGCESPLLVGDVEDYGVYINSVGGAPVADFSGTPTTLCEGNTVSFTDLSTNTPTSWSWTFTGGTPSSSTAQNPTITYNTAGIYQVELTATNASGNDTETKVGYITVNANPSIVTSSTNETCLKNDGTATASGGGAYLWNDSSAQTTPTATGLSAGIYIVTVTLNGCSSQQNVTVNADNCIPNTEIKPQFCGLVLGNITDEVSAYKIPGASAYEYRLTEQGIGTVLTYTYSLYKLKLAWVPGIKYNATYSIEVRGKIGNDWGAFSNVCIVTTPVMSTPDVLSNVCGNVVSSLKELIYVKSVKKATNYEYRLTEKGTSNIYYWNNTIWRIQLSWFGSAIKYNTVYELQTRAYVNGDWSEFSPICEITTPGIPLSNVSSGQCGTTISSLGELIYFSPVLNTTNYEYKLTEKGTSNIYYWNNSIWRVRLSWFGVPFQQNTVYELQARAYINGDWGNYGAICEITTPASSSRLAFSDDDRLVNGQLQNSFNNIQLIIYPNPSQGEFVYMELKSSEDISELMITDVTGKIVHQQNLQTEDYYSTIRFNEKLNPGFYFVTVVSGSQKQTKKLVVK